MLGDLSKRYVRPGFDQRQDLFGIGIDPVRALIAAELITPLDPVEA